MYIKGYYQESDKANHRMGKIFANHVSDKSLVSTIFKNSHDLSYRDKKNKGTKDLNTHFIKEDTQMANKHMKRCSTLLVTRVSQTKTTVRYYYTTFLL